MAFGGNWIGPAIQAGSDVANSALGAIFAKKAAKKAHQRSVDAYKHRYQWTMADMRSAGLNPILAAGQGAGSAPSAPIATRSGGTSDYAGAYAKSSRLQGEMKLLTAQTDAASAAGAKSLAEMSTVDSMREHLVRYADANAQHSAYGLNFARNDNNYYGTPQGRTMQQLQRAQAAGGNVGAAIQGVNSAFGFLSRGGKTDRTGKIWNKAAQDNWDRIKNFFKKTSQSGYRKRK